MTKRTILPGAVLLGLLSALSVAQVPVPFINQPLVPTATAPGGPQFTLTVNGTGFTSGSVVHWNGSGLATTFMSSSQLTAIVPAANIATAGTAWVTVVTPAPGGRTSATALFPVTNPSSTVGFQRQDIPIGPALTGVATGDFNGDGKLDLAVSSEYNNAVSVLIGNGDGTFQPHVDYAIGDNPRSVLVGDFNGDGKLDIATTGYLDNKVSILTGNGDGTFQSVVRFRGGDKSMVSGDFNGDGLLDFAATSIGGVVSIELNQGGGEFVQATAYSLFPNPGPIVAGDLNGDGKLDLVVGDNISSGKFAVLLGNGDGTFQVDTTQSTINHAASMLLADFDGDGKLDLAVFGEGALSPGIEIMLGNGDGTFRSFSGLSTDCGASVLICTAATADINGDGKLDLLVRKSPGNTIQIFLGNGDGTFQSPVSFKTGENPEQVVVGDFNGDGRLDLAVVSNNFSSVSVFLQQSHGPAATLSLSSMFFGGQLLFTSSLPQSVTLTNTGTETLDISGISVSGSFSERTDCGSSLSAGRHCTITVIFHASKLGNSDGNVTITDNAANSPQTLTLTGVGTGVTISPGGLAFGPQNVGTNSSPLTVTLTNHLSGEAVPIYSAGIHGVNSPSFAEISTCGTSVAAGASCTFSVTFTPLSKGPKEATLEIRYGGGGYPVGLTGTGQ